MPVYRVHAQSDSVDRQARWRRTYALNTYPWMVRKYKDKLSTNQFGDADKTQAGRVCRTGEQRIHGNTQLNNYLSLFGTRRDQLLVEAKFTARSYWRWI